MAFTAGYGLRHVKRDIFGLLLLVTLTYSGTEPISNWHGDSADPLQQMDVINLAVAVGLSSSSARAGWHLCAQQGCGSMSTVSSRTCTRQAFVTQRTKFTRPYGPVRSGPERPDLVGSGSSLGGSPAWAIWFEDGEILASQREALMARRAVPDR